jgi:hypothetical protein
MNRFVYINENQRFLEKGVKISEGGLSRNFAIMTWIYEHVDHLHIVKLHKNKLINALRVLYTLLFSKHDDIFFQYTTVGIPLFRKHFIWSSLSRFYLICLKYSCNQNTIIFDVADLKYEQSIDLEINSNKILEIQKFEDVFFRFPAKFIFASESMRKYAADKYAIPLDNTDVCINGGNKLIRDYDLSRYESLLNNSNIKFVYAGSLNQGRSVEKMIKAFPDRTGLQMIVMGPGGEWIQAEAIGGNIHYLGALEEEEAHQITSRCDIGLIPYDNSRMYFNLAYPTKLSFYITAKIPYLSTPVQEANILFDKYGLGIIAELDQWNTLYTQIDPTIILSQHQIVNSVSDNFYWNSILDNNLFIKSKFIANGENSF